MQKKLLILGLVIFVMAGVAEAQTSTPKVTLRQVKQYHRIHQGIDSGELTKREAKSLKTQQANIRCHKKAVRADGVVTKKERARLDAHQDAASRNIWRKKHNVADRI